jgi:hypothetical protein
MKYYISLILFVVVFSACDNTPKSVEMPDKDARNTIIYADEINEKIKDGKEIYYEDAVIVGDIDFTLSPDISIETPSVMRHYHNTGVLFSNCTFQGEIIAARKNNEKHNYLYFDRGISFLNCTFQSKVNFSETRFDHLALFRENIYQDTVVFNGASFNFKKNYFHNSQFLAFADFSETIFKGESSFLKSEFRGNLLFQSAVFYETVNFGAIHLYEKSDFSLNSYRGGFNLRYATFEAPCTFNQSQFGSEVQMDDINSREILKFENSIFLKEPKSVTAELSDIISFKNTRFIIE